MTKLRLRFLRLLRFFAAKFPNPFTTNYADSADKKLASVLSVPSCKIRPPTARLLLPRYPRSVASVTKLRLRFLRLLRFFAANPLPPAERPAHLADPPSVLRPPPRRRSHHRQIAPHRRPQARAPILHDRRSRPFHQQPRWGPGRDLLRRIGPVGPTGRSTSAAVAGAVVRSCPGRWAVAQAGFRADR